MQEGERKWEMEKTESRKKVLLTALRAVECGPNDDPEVMRKGQVVLVMALTLQHRLTYILVWDTLYKQNGKPKHLPVVENVP